jgi:polysaccharide pyruvyl transferase WcaK-like protein
MDARKVLLVGAFGQGNPGDEALLSSFLRELEGWWPVATSSAPEATRRWHGCDAVSSRSVNEVARAAAAADALVFAGGTIFKNLHPAAGRSPGDLLRKGLVLASTARVMGKPVAMLGVGAGRLEGAHAAFLARAFAQRTDLLVLRDEESARILAQAGVRPPFRVGADPSWVLFDEPGRPEAGAEHAIVALSHLAGDSSLGGRLVEALAPFVASGLPLQIQPWQAGVEGEGDVPLAREVAGRIGARVIDPPRSLRDAVRRFGSARLVVGLRYHALIAASLAGVPFVAYGHEAKLVGLAARLGQPCSRPEGGPMAFGEAIRAALGTKAPCPSDVSAQMAAATAEFRLLRLLLDGPSPEVVEDVPGLRLAPSPV